MIRVLVAEDSLTVRELLIAVLGADPDIQIVGAAKNGVEAVDMTRRLRPDVITMDVNMPLLDGFEATKRIMSETPTPIVIISGSVDVGEVEISMYALRMGALTLLQKPVGPAGPEFDKRAQRIVSTVKAMADVKVVTQRAAQTRRAPARPPQVLDTSARIRVVAIAASTGGPAALQEILSGLPADFPAPILVVQHIGEEFAEGLIAWLNRVSPLKAQAAVDGETLAPGALYLSVNNGHLGVSRFGRIVLSDAPPIDGFRPSATHLFESVGTSFGTSGLGVVLTGMGRDGADGLRALRQNGGRVIAQDETTSVVFGMPKAAIETGNVDVVLPLSAIAPQLIETVCNTHGAVS